MLARQRRTCGAERERETQAMSKINHQPEHREPSVILRRALWGWARKARKRGNICSKSLRFFQGPGLMCDSFNGASAGVGKSCVLPLRVSNPSPTLDKILAPEESEKSLERVPRQRAPKVPKECAPECSFRTLLRLRGALFGHFWGPSPGYSFWTLFGLFRGLPGSKGPGDPVWGGADRNPRWGVPPSSGSGKFTEKVLHDMGHGSNSIAT